MNGLSNKPFYVFLFPLFPVIALLSTNINEMALVEGLRAAVFALAAAGVLLLLLGIRKRQWHRAALTLAPILLGFLSYGHFYKLFLDLTGLKNNDTVYSWSSAVTLLAFFTVALFIWFRVKQPERFAQNLNIIGLIVVLLPAVHITANQVEGNSAVPPTPLTQTPNPGQTTSFRPDIYYIILDGYARADVLSAVYGYDNGPFISELESRGFFVAQESRTNYISTLASLSSSLNLRFLDELAQQVGTDSDNRLPLSNMVRNNEVQYFLHNLNYETITISSGYTNTEARNADRYLTSSFHGINNFETLLLQHTPIGRYIVIPGFLLENGLLFAPHRDRIQFSFNSLANTIPEIGSPKYVFAHIVAPHPPFVFGPDGEAVQPNYGYTLQDGSHFPGTTEEYREGYRNQVIYINKRLLETIDMILAKSATPPVIIIQSDHGPGSTLDWRGPAQNDCLKERTSNFVAILTPDDRPQFYDTITPVNIFRTLFNSYFDMDFEQMPDKTFFTIPTRPYEYIEITDQIEGSAACFSQ